MDNNKKKKEVLKERYVRPTVIYSNHIYWHYSVSKQSLSHSQLQQQALDQ